ncbi:hypothetical protein GCM10009539_16790 [Cryptosporangium japonicum]|uniref:Uncharacterized protein n=1 Tax=Cryptosporangium japonicum TaxID=80872 RepID=A0ABP3DGC8_9ACTN
MTCRRGRGGLPPGFAGGNTADRTSHSAFVRSPRATHHPTTETLFKHGLAAALARLAALVAYGRGRALHPHAETAGRWVSLPVRPAAPTAGT